MATSFQDKVAIVTGSNSGFGEDIAITLANRGACVTLTGRDTERLEASLQKCVTASGGFQDRFLTVVGNIMDSAHRKRIIEETIRTFSKLDILICNAGAADASGLDEATEEVFDHMFDLNVKSTFFLIQAALPHLIKSKGNVVITSSMSSQIACAPMVVYPMSKAAVDHMCRCLALDLAPRGIRINTVNPSYTVTRITRGRGDENIDKLGHEVADVERPQQPLHNRLVTLRDISEAVLFLASDAAEFITGQNLRVDGGRALTGPQITTYSL